MSDSTPFQDVTDGLLAFLAGGLDRVTGVEEYNGQAFDRLRQMARERGTIGFVRVVGALSAGNDPVAADGCEITAQVIVAAPAVERQTASQNAWAAAWAAYKLLRRTTAGIECLSEPWRLAGFKLEEQAPDCTVVWVMLAAHIDFSEVD